MTILTSVSIFLLLLLSIYYSYCYCCYHCYYWYYISLIYLLTRARPARTHPTADHHCHRFVDLNATKVREHQAPSRPHSRPHSRSSRAGIGRTPSRQGTTYLSSHTTACGRRPCPRSSECRHGPVGSCCCGWSVASTESSCGTGRTSSDNCRQTLTTSSGRWGGWKRTSMDNGEVCVCVCVCVWCFVGCCQGTSVVLFSPIANMHIHSRGFPFLWSQQQGRCVCDPAYMCDIVIYWGTERA